MPIWTKKNQENELDAHGRKGEKREQDQENEKNSGIPRTVTSIHANAKKAIIKKKTETKERLKKKKMYTLQEKMDKKKRHMGKELHRTGK